MIEHIREELNLLAEENIRAYTLKVVPTVQPERVIGVSVPRLRKIARNITKSDWRKFLAEADGNSIEELMLSGFVTAGANMPDSERFEKIQNFVPKIDNWAVCDTFCSSVNITADNKNQYWEFIQPYFYSPEPYRARFGIVTLLSNFSQEEYSHRAFAIFNSIKHEDYYVKMAVAWAISVYFVACPEPTMKFILNNNVDDFTFNKALQKIIESRRVDDKTKNTIKLMKRK